MKHKVGDIIRVKSDLECSVSYPNDGGGSGSVVIGMKRYTGKISRISEIRGVYYILEEDAEKWFWTDGMFDENFVSIESIEGEKDMLGFVFVTFRENEKAYLFSVPQGIKLKAGEEVFVETVHGKTHATVLNDSFEIDINNAHELIYKCIGLKEMKYVTGYAVREKWVEKEFEIEA